MFSIQTLSSRLFYNPSGHRLRYFSLCAGDSIQLCISGEVYAEYEEVIRRPRFRRDETVIAAALDTVREKGFWVKPTEAIRECVDPDDDIFLECAYAARAAYLVTGNLKHFPAAWRDTRIVTARRFLEIMAGETEQRSRRDDH